MVDFVYGRMKEEMKLSKIVEALFDAILSPGPSKQPQGCDNMSCIIIQMKKKK